jgi:hypothetical protein
MLFSGGGEDWPGNRSPTERSQIMDSPTAAATASATRASATGEQAWLTAVLRPAGSLDQAAVARLRAAVGHLAAASDMVLVDLTAADVRAARALALALREPATAFERAGRCLLLVGASPALRAELDRAAVPVATLAGDVLPVQASGPVAAGHPAGAAPAPAPA